MSVSRSMICIIFREGDVCQRQRRVVGSLVNIKPILTVTADGKLKSDGTVRGRKKSLKTLVSRMEEALDLDTYGKDRMVAVLHGDCFDEAETVAEMVKEMGFSNVVINDVSPSIGTHAGAGSGRTCALRKATINKENVNDREQALSMCIYDTPVSADRIRFAADRPVKIAVEKYDIIV